jgi:tRNA pseudouridine55 synthase
VKTRADHSARYGLVLLRKPEGLTSFRALGPVKRRLGIDKIGHAGTLDRFAGGLLVALCGSYSRLAGFVQAGEKSYRATVFFGSETDTLDPEGRIIARADPPTRESLENVLTSFTGTIMQTPPLYSAIHINGQRAYEHALAGRNPEIKQRPVTIHSLRLISYDGVMALLDVTCSSGTYIRSLARDIALACASRAHLTALERLAIGPYRIEEAVDPESFNPEKDVHLFTASEAEGLGLSVAVLATDKVDHFRSGSKLDPCDFHYSTSTNRGTDTAVFGVDGTFLGIVHNDGTRVTYRCVIAGGGNYR